MEACHHAQGPEHEMFRFMIITALKTLSMMLDNSVQSNPQSGQTAFQSACLYEDL